MKPLIHWIPIHGAKDCYFFVSQDGKLEFRYIGTK